MNMKTKLLICRCGDCSHWEVIHRADDTTLKCVTCGVEYTATVTIDPHEDLHYVEHEA
jgi:ribosomal protein S27E